MKKVVILMAVLALASVAVADEIPVGSKAPGFSLVNAVDGETVVMKPNDGKLKVVIFTCNQCPYAKAFEPRIIQIANKFQQQGIRFYALDPNDDSKYPEETLVNMKARAEEKDYPFPYLKDGDSKTARAYGARVTPHVYVVDGDGTVVYKGYIDDSAKPDQRTSTALTDALNALTNGRDVATTDTRAFGCSIKWKS